MAKFSVLKMSEYKRVQQDYIITTNHIECKLQVNPSRVAKFSTLEMYECTRMQHHYIITTRRHIPCESCKSIRFIENTFPGTENIIIKCGKYISSSTMPMAAYVAQHIGKPRWKVWLRNASPNATLQCKQTLGELQFDPFRMHWGFYIVQPFFPFCLPKTFWSGKLSHPQRIKLHFAQSSFHTPILHWACIVPGCPTFSDAENCRNIAVRNKD